MSIFAKWKRLREVKVRVLDIGGLFYGLRFSQGYRCERRLIAGMDALLLNYWLSKFVMEVAKKSSGKKSLLPYCC